MDLNETQSIHGYVRWTLFKRIVKHPIGSSFQKVYHMMIRQNLPRRDDPTTTPRIWEEINTATTTTTTTTTITNQWI
jgi:hypothetical protein